MFKNILIQHSIAMDLLNWVITDGKEGIINRRLVSILIIKAIKYETLHRIKHKRYRVDKTQPYYEILESEGLIKLHTFKLEPYFDGIDDMYIEVDDIMIYHILDYIKGE